jgi:hypothetical protein
MKNVAAKKTKSSNPKAAHAVETAKPREVWQSEELARSKGVVAAQGGGVMATTTSTEKITATVTDRYTSGDGTVTYVNEVVLPDGSKMVRVCTDSVRTFGENLREDVEALSAGAHNIVDRMGDDDYDFDALLERIDLRMAGAVHMIRYLEEGAGLRRGGL